MTIPFPSVISSPLKSSLKSLFIDWNGIKISPSIDSKYLISLEKKKFIEGESCFIV